MPGGIVVALLLPILGLPLTDAPQLAVALIIMLIYTISFARVDLRPLAANVKRVQWWVSRLGIVALLLVISPVAWFALSSLLRLGDALTFAVVIVGLSPPIAAAANMCLLMRLNAVIALEVAVLASVLCPFIAPWVAWLLVGDQLEISPLALSARIALIIGIGATVGILVRRALGPVRVLEHRLVFDGLSALAMALFVLPIFGEVPGFVLSEPGLTIALLAMAFLANWGSQWIFTRGLMRWQTPSDAGAIGMVSGNRSVGLFFAALPPDPAFAVFVALYQLPMFATPLCLNWWYRSQLARHQA